MSQIFFLQYALLSGGLYVFMLSCFRTHKLNKSLVFERLIHVVSSVKKPGPMVIKLFSCSTQLSTKFHLLIKTKIPTIDAVSCFSSSDIVFILQINVKCQQLLAF